MKSRRTIFLAGVALVLAALAAYRNSLAAPFLFDDMPAVLQNRTIRQWWPPWPALNPPADGSGVSGRPLVNFSLAVNYACGGLDVRGYHAMNLALHVLATLALWGVLRRTLRSAAAGVAADDAELMAWSAALLWTVHPLLTESVVCVVQRNEIMGSLFYLLTIYGFIRGAETGRRGWLVGSCLAALAGVASKEITATAPLLVLLYDRTFAAGSFGAAWRRRWQHYLALAATWLLLGGLVWHNRQRGGTVGFGLGVTPWDYLLTQCRALVLYLKLSVWPHPLVIDYGTAVVRSPGAVWGQGLAVLGLLAATVGALVRKPVLGFAGAAFFLILAPSSSFVPLVTQTIAEHRMYLPLAAVLALLVPGAFALAGRRAVPVCLAAALALAVVTARRNEAFRDEYAVWRTAVAAQPDNARAWSGLGIACYHHDDFAGAVRSYGESLRLDPRSMLTHYNLGLTFYKMERWAEAAAQYEEALRLDPRHTQARAELGATLLKLGRTAEALTQLRRALAEAPDIAETHNTFGMALAASGDPAGAVQAYEAALKLNPFLSSAHYNLALVLAGQGRTAEALAHYADAVRGDPTMGEARLNLGILLAQGGRNDEALVQLRAVVKLRPGLAAAHCNLGILLAQMGRTPEAVREYGEALRLQPDYVVAHYNLGNALLQLQQWSEAKRHFAEAVRLAPGFGPAREMLDRLDAVP